ncbi:MAG: N-acetylneuraminate synthase [Sphingobacteriales bacterium]|nr:MAG: N-acetylneuraminate synthase [Sphingobacteriales bacterium]
MISIKKPYIIGETAFHHEGEIDFLFELIDTACDLEIDAIKFHALFNVDDYFAHDHEGIGIIKKISLDQESMLSAVTYAQSKKLDVILLCNDVASIDWVIQNNLDLKAIEIHATGLNDIFLLDKSVLFTGTVILGIGGSTIDEVKFATDYLRERGKEDLLLMHGFQNYPTSYADVFLQRIEKFQQLFGLPMGYADHTNPADVNNEWISSLGISKGALVLEKHFTTRPAEKRIDAQAAVSISQMKRLKEVSHIIFEALGLSNPLSFSKAEQNYGNTGPMKKAPVARRPIAKGETITLESVAFKRTRKSACIQQKDVLQLIGAVANQDISTDEIIDYSKIEYEFRVIDDSQFRNTHK